MIPHVLEVKPLPQQRLWLRFDTGKTGVFDLAPYLDRGRFSLLKDEGFFNQVRIAFGTVEWPGEIDLDPEDLHDYSVPE
jgi:hypothetical protein